MVQVIKLISVDDSNGTEYVEVMLCKDMEQAKERVLDEMNEVFESSFLTLEEAEEVLADELSLCVYGGNTFEWFDNGNGVTYMFGSVYEERKNVFQRFCALV